MTQTVSKQNFFLLKKLIYTTNIFIKTFKKTSKHFLLENIYKVI